MVAPGSSAGKPGMPGSVNHDATMGGEPMVDEKASTDEDDGGQGASYRVLGLVFGLLGLVMLLGTDSRAAGLPFLVIGITFFVIGRNGGRRRSSSGGSGDGPTRE